MYEWTSDVSSTWNPDACLKLLTIVLGVEGTLGDDLGSHFPGNTGVAVWTAQTCIVAIESSRGATEHQGEETMASPHW